MDLPFFCTYPLNCCQGTSILLGQLILDLHSNAEITIVKGSSRKDDNHHYWLEVDKNIFDLTVEQFVSWMDKKYHCPASPIYGEKKHSLTNYFSISNDFRLMKHIRYLLLNMRMKRMLWKLIVWCY
jgi:hypothetical protein